MKNTYLAVMAGINLFLEWAMRVVLIFMTVIVFAQVLSRFFHFSMPQLEELARYSNIYLAFLAVAYGTGKNSLMKVDVLQTSARGKAYVMIVLLADIFSFAICALYVYSGIKLVGLGIGQRSSSMGFDLSLVYIIIPACFVLAILNKIAYTIKRKGDNKT